MLFRSLAVNEARARESGPGVRRNASGPRSMAPTDWATGSGVAETRPPHRGGASRNFGPDATPRGERKSANRRPKSTRGPKGPIRERVGGQFFAGDEDDADSDVANREHVARHLSDSEREDRD